MKTKNILPVSLCLLLSTANQAAEQSTPVIIDASPCLALTRPIERLTCFEDLAQAAQQPGASIPQQNLPVVSIPVTQPGSHNWRSLSRNPRHRNGSDSRKQFRGKLRHP